MTLVSVDSELAPSRLAELAEQFIVDLREGSDPTVEQLAAAAPDQETAIRDLFPTIRTLERLRLQSAWHSGVPASLGGKTPRQLGDYRLLREIGRGGMGVVFEAEQETLGRRVAVKVLPRPLLADPRRVERFQREAQTAASLHHTHIVPVFGVGQHDGFHFYVMQRIEGSGLDKFLRGLRSGSWPIPNAPRAQWGAQVGRQAAAALQYAHERGVLHRDIKPANLLIDANGKVWVTDFGLATAFSRVEDAEAPRANGAANEVVGTLRYMAPEQFQGQADPRSDLYSLGLTLYEIVTGTAAAANPAASTADRLANPLTPPRQLDPTIPRDLEAIILRATQLAPERRYGSAAELGEDLERFLAGLPVLARRPTWFERVWRWSGRNPTTAGLLFLCVVLATLCCGVVGWDYWRIQQAWQRESWSRIVAERNARVATDALDQIFSRFSGGRSATLNAAGPWLETTDQPVLSQEVASLLNELLAYYDRLAAEQVENPATMRKGAEARRSVGDIHQQLGQHSAAIEAYQQALELHARLDRNLPASRSTSNVADALARAQLENGIGRAYQLLEDNTASRAAHGRALAGLESLRPTESERAAVRYEQARTHFLLARRVRPGMGPRALPPSDPTRRPNDGNRPQDRADAAIHLRSAVEILESLAPRDGGDPAQRLLLAACLREQASDFLATRSRDDERADAEATEMLQELCQEHPESTLYRFEFAQTLAEFSVFGESLGDGQLQPAEKRLRQALELLETLVAEHPQVTEYASSLLHTHGKLGTVLERQSFVAESPLRATLLADAEKNFRRAVQGATQLGVRFPDSPGYAAWQALFQERLGTILRQQGRGEESYVLLARSARSLLNLLQKDSSQSGLRSQLSRTYRSLAETCDQTNQLAAAQAAREAASRLAGDNPHDAPYRPPVRPRPPR